LPKDVVVGDYWAVHIRGGYGFLFDVANNHELQSIISTIYAAGGIIGGGGHSSGAFANVKLASG
jgi:putative intracellular protease/amidase